MKNYLEQFNGDTIQARNALLNDVESLLKNTSVVSKTYGKGVITGVSREATELNLDRIDFVVNITFEGEVLKQFCIGVAVNNNAMTIDENIFKTYTEYLSDLKVIYEVMKEEWKKKEDEEFKQRMKERDERIQKEKEIKLEQKREKQKQSQIERANELSETKLKVCDGFYSSLGWLAKHSKQITAALPDYLDKWFVKEFGDVERRVVDQSKLSPSGLPSQFALYLKIDLDTNTNIPSYLSNKLGDVKKEIKPISDTSFVFDLVRDYGFQFGKKQDLDKIMENIPTNYLEEFRLGLNA